MGQLGGKTVVPDKVKLIASSKVSQVLELCGSGCFPRDIAALEADLPSSAPAATR